MQSSNKMPIEAYLNYMNRPYQKTTPCEHGDTLVPDTTPRHETASLTARNTLDPIGIPLENKRSQNANTSHLTPVLDEVRLWADHADLIAALPEADRTAVQLGILEEYITAGIRQGKPMITLFLLACLGISIANNDRPFYDGIRNELSHQEKQVAVL